MPKHIARRSVLKAAIAGWVGLLSSRAHPKELDIVGAPLSPWRPGLLDIHQIATGRGDATLIVSPRGRLALIDAGAVVGTDPAQVAARPDASRSPGEWIARYIARRMRETGATGLDSLVVTHLHQDHIGGVESKTPIAPGGHYRLTGVSDVAHRVRVARLLDPDWPDYSDIFEGREQAENYLAFARKRSASGQIVERLRVGTADQVLESASEFSVRTVAARGRVWTGSGVAVRDVFARSASLPQSERPNENARSAALIVDYGSFRFFIGGDLTDWATAGTNPWLNALTPTAQAVGPVDVAVLPHHGMYDASSVATIRALAAQVWTISAWHAAHPSLETLERLFNRQVLPTGGDVYATDIHPATDLVMARLTGRLTAKGGHIVTRVSEGGRRFQTFVTDSRTETDLVLHAGRAFASSSGERQRLLRPVVK